MVRKIGLLLIVLVGVVCVDTKDAKANDKGYEFHISTSSGQKVVNHKKIIKGTQLCFDVKKNKNTSEAEKTTYNFYYIVNKTKRNYIAKDVEDGCVWDTSKLCEFKDYEIHMSINKYNDYEMQENISMQKYIVHIVDGYELFYMPNYKESNVYSRSFIYEAKKEEMIKDNFFEREGYTFLEWNENEDGSGKSYKEGSTITLNSNLALYAIWKKGTYDKNSEHKDKKSEIDKDEGYLQNIEESKKTDNKDKSNKSKKEKNKDKDNKEKRKSDKTDKIDNKDSKDTKGNDNKENTTNNNKLTDEMIDDINNNKGMEKESMISSSSKNSQNVEKEEKKGLKASDIVVLLICSFIVYKTIIYTVRNYKD